MSKQRKGPKQRGAGASGGGGGVLLGDTASRWVAKGTASRQKEQDDLSLEEFKKNWEPLPDEGSVSNVDYYFNSYAHFGIHEDMLKDQVRTGSYMRAIVNNPNLFRGKTVLDIGSGTGILCLFAAKAGAARCFGIECSDIIDYATLIAKENGYGDTITYVRGKVEEVELPVQKVDIIISEWMGYFLIYESMLDSVLFARDKWLTADGLLFPDHASIHVAGIEDADYKEEKIGFWNQLWGFDFSSMRQNVLQEPISDTVGASALATTSRCLLELDLYTVSRADLDFMVPFSIRATRKDFIHALVVWFDVSFRACSPRVVLTTAPDKAYTHWKQTVLYLEDALAVFAGEELKGVLAARKNKQNHRDLDVKLSFELVGKHGFPPKVQYFRLR